jgi:hypothetical protein
MRGISTGWNETTIRDCDIVVEQGDTGTTPVYGIAISATSSRDNTVTVMRSRIRALGNNQYGFGIYTYLTATSTNTINIYDCDVYGGTNGGTAYGRGLDLRGTAGNAPYANVYGCRIYGVTNDIITNSPSTDPDKVKLYGTICYNQLPTSNILSTGTMFAGGHRIYSPTQYQIIIGTHIASTNTLRMYTDSYMYGNIRNAQNAGFAVTPYGAYLIDSSNRWVNWTGNYLWPSQPSDIGRPDYPWRYGYFSGALSVGSSITVTGDIYTSSSIIASSGRIYSPTQYQVIVGTHIASTNTLRIYADSVHSAGVVNQLGNGMVVSSTGTMVYGGSSWLSASNSGITLSVPGDSANEAVRADRTIATGNGLTGGGDLTADRTLSVVQGAGMTVNTGGVHLNTNTPFIGTMTWTSNHTFASSVSVQSTLESRNLLVNPQLIGTLGYGTGDAALLVASSHTSWVMTVIAKNGGTGMYVRSDGVAAALKSDYADGLYIESAHTGMYVNPRSPYDAIRIPSGGTGVNIYDSVSRGIYSDASDNWMRKQLAVGQGYIGTPTYILEASSNTGGTVASIYNSNLSAGVALSVTGGTAIAAAQQAPDGDALRGTIGGARGYGVHIQDLNAATGTIVAYRAHLDSTGASERYGLYLTGTDLKHYLEGNMTLTGTINPDTIKVGGSGWSVYPYIVRDTDGGLLVRSDSNIRAKFATGGNIHIVNHNASIGYWIDASTSYRWGMLRDESNNLSFRGNNSSTYGLSVCPSSVVTSVPLTVQGTLWADTVKVGVSGGSVYPYLMRDTADGGLLVKMNDDTRAKVSTGGNMHLTRPNASIGYWIDASTSFRWGMLRDESNNLSFRGNDSVTYGLSVCPSSVVTNVQFAALQNSKVIVQISSAQTFPSGELRKVWFTSVVYDQRGDYNSSLSKFTAPHTGIYHVTAQTMVTSTWVPTSVGWAYIYVGGCLHRTIRSTFGLRRGTIPSLSVRRCTP